MIALNVVLFDLLVSTGDLTSVFGESDVMVNGFFDGVQEGLFLFLAPTAVWSPPEPRLAEDTSAAPLAVASESFACRSSRPVEPAAPAESVPGEPAVAEPLLPDDEEESLGPSAHATPGIDATAAPTPRATANAPTRPT
ncbi:MAG TPA: hypothetical protein VH496_01535 [Mycobacterium sp.]